MKVVVLDGYTVNPGDLDWQPILDVGDVDIYDRSTPKEIVPRSLGAEVILVNKVHIGEKEMAALPDLKGICMLATGYDNVDIEVARKKGIRVYNAVGYGSESVAQHAMAIILAFANRVESHHRSVQHGDWSAQNDFSYTLHSVSELKGKTLGIFGYGKIGQRLGEMALAFSMQVIAHARSAIIDANVESVDRESLFSRSDFLSLHSPLTEDTREVVNARTLATMRKNAVLINTGRGGLINEKDLVNAVTTGRIAGAGLDVLQQEPPRDKNPLLHVKGILITPHMAWRSCEARQALIAITAENIGRVRSGSKKNRIV